MCGKDEFCRPRNARLLVLQIFIQGHENLNRAVQQDVVAIEMLPETHWTCPSSLILEDDEEKADEDIADEDQQVRTSAAQGPKQATARIVGIIKRNWRQYCGMLQPSVMKGVSV